MSVSVSESLHAVTELTSGRSHFFGFHDLTPWDPASRELICLRTDTEEDHVPTYRDEAEVCIIHEATKEVTSIGTTRAWNWQQAARQRWIPALGGRVVIYNAEDDDGFCSHIVDLDSDERHTLPAPVYDVSNDGVYALTVNFHRLHVCSPDYGYDHASQPASLPEYAADGIFRLSLDGSEPELILSIKELLDHKKISGNEGQHYFTHILIAPDDRQFCFLHRCIHPTGSINTNLVVANDDGSNVRVVAQDKVSHFDWRDDENIIVWCRENAAIQKLKSSPLMKFARFLYRLSTKITSTSIRQSVYGEAFRQVNVHSGEKAPVGDDVLEQDGHPQVHPMHPQIWVNDTYPNAEGVQTLMLFNQETNDRRDLLQLPTQPSIQETRWRCDFHPRWAPDGETVCFDSAHHGRRQLCLLDVGSTIQEMVSSA
jgi:hypothetical protein